MQDSRNTGKQFTCSTAAALLLLGVTTSAFAGQVSIPFHAGDFTSPRDNLYLPMAIGRTYVYEAEEEDGLVHDEITQTTNSVSILGVNCTEVYDVEWIAVEGIGLVKAEETYDWIAWDNWGNAWYFGEDTTEYLYDDNWNPVGTSQAGSWRAGVDGAEPGILMLAAPAVGDNYLQEYYAGVAEDAAKVLRLNATVAIDLGEFTDCAETKEWTPLAPGSNEHKYYAPEVGLVYVQELKGKTVQVELVEIR